MLVDKIRIKTMQETNTQKNFYCLECNEQFSKGGDCPHCIDEPLLPLDRTQVRSFIENVEKGKRSIGQQMAYNIAMSVPVLGFVAGCGWLISQLFS